MKFQLVISFLIICSINCFGQNPTTRYVGELWDEDKEDWYIQSEDTWKYNAKRQNIQRQKKYFRSDGQVYYDREQIIEYDNQGNSIRFRSVIIDSGIRSTSSGDTQYNEFNQRIASSHTRFDDQGTSLYEEKTEYEYDNPFSTDWAVFRLYHNTDAGWEKDLEIVKRLDAQGCLVNYTQFIFIHGMSDTTILEDRFTRNEACQIDTYEYWNYSSHTDIPYAAYARAVYQYPNDDLDYIQIRYGMNYETGELEESSYREEDFNDDGQSIRVFSRSYDGPGLSDTSIFTRSYTDRGLVQVANSWKVNYDFNDVPQYTMGIDSFGYKYEQDFLVEKRQRRTNFSVFDDEIITEYEYYCNGELKSEAARDLIEGPIGRKSYEYLVDVDCSLTQETASLTIFPNPTSGELFILSNMLDAQDANYAVYSITGQLLRSGVFPQSFTPTEIELGAEYDNGYYVLKLFTEDIVVAEKFVLIH